MNRPQQSLVPDLINEGPCEPAADEVDFLAQCEFIMKIQQEETRFQHEQEQLLQQSLERASCSTKTSKTKRDEQSLQEPEQHDASIDKKDTCRAPPSSRSSADATAPTEDIRNHSTSSTNHRQQRHSKSRARRRGGMRMSTCDLEEELSSFSCFPSTLTTLAGDYSTSSTNVNGNISSSSASTVQDSTIQDLLDESSLMRYYRPATQRHGKRARRTLSSSSPCDLFRQEEEEESPEEEERTGGI